MKQKIEVDCGIFSGSVSANWVRRTVLFALNFEKSKRRFVSVRLTGDREIRRINKKFLKHDYATDVISLEPAFDPAFGPAFEPAGPERDYLGDIVVSVETARAVAKEMGLPWRRELARYLVHGALHLLGYDDHGKPKRKKMFLRQEKILTAFFKKAKFR